MRSLKKFLMLMTILFLLASCAQAPNIELCGKIPNGNGGRCAFTFEGPKRSISEEKWNAWANSNLGMVCTDAKGWSEVAKMIKKTCAKNKNFCQKYVKNPRSHIDELEKLLLSKGGD